MKFLLDENVPRTLGKFLSKQGYNVQTLQELGKQGINNGEVTEIALNLGAIVLTFDKDFTILSDILQSKSRIIFIKLHPRDPRVAVELLKKHLHESLDILKNPGVVKITKLGVSGR